MNTKRLNFKSLFTIFLLAVMTLLPALVVAQEATPEEPVEGDLVVVTGELTFVDGEIWVEGYKIAPAGAFQPSDYAAGDVVIIIGVLLPDGVTIQALSIELFSAECDDPETADVVEECEEEDPEVTPEVTPEETPDVEPEETPETTPETTPEATVEPTPEATPDEDDDDDEVVLCRNSHPVAARIANEFDITEAEVIALHCGGYGFGNIMLALSLARNAGVDLEDILALRDSGMGWGKIAREFDMRPGQIAPGKVLGRGHLKRTNDGEAQSAERNVQRGNGKGNKGNNGRGNDKGNNGNNSRGNDKGNNGNNGRGNGRGN